MPSAMTWLRGYVASPWVVLALTIIGLEIGYGFASIALRLPGVQVGVGVLGVGLLLTGERDRRAQRARAAATKRRTQLDEHRQQLQAFAGEITTRLGAKQNPAANIPLWRAFKFHEPYVARWAMANWGLIQQDLRQPALRTSTPNQLRPAWESQVGVTNIQTAGIGGACPVCIDWFRAEGIVPPPSWQGLVQRPHPSG